MTPSNLERLNGVLDRLPTWLLATALASNEGMQELTRQLMSQGIVANEARRFFEPPQSGDWIPSQIRKAAVERLSADAKKHVAEAIRSQQKASVSKSA